MVSTRSGRKSISNDTTTAAGSATRTTTRTKTTTRKTGPKSGRKKTEETTSPKKRNRSENDEEVVETPKRKTPNRGKKSTSSSSTTPTITERKNPLQGKKLKVPFRDGIKQGVVDERVEKLEKRNIFYGEIAMEFQDIVFDKYIFDHRKTPKQKLTETIKLAKEHIKFQTYFPSFAWKPRFVKLAARYSEKELATNWPSLPFHIINGVFRCQKLFDKVMNLFYMEIHDYLNEKDEKSATDIKNWMGICKDMPFIDDLIEKGQNAYCVPLRLEKEVKALKIPEHKVPKSIIEDFISRAGEHFENDEVGPEKAIEHIKHLANSTSEERRDELREALVENGLSLRSDSRLCSAYIEGTSDCYLYEVVGIMAIAKELFSYSHIAWSNCADTWESELRENVYEDNISWEESWTRVCRQEPEYDEYDYPFDRYGY